MVNLYNASKEALSEMRAGNYHNIKLEIEHSPSGSSRWIFTKIPEGFFSRTIDALHTFFQKNLSENNPSGPDIEFKFGEDIRQFHEQGEMFHKKLQRAVPKAALLGKGLSKIREEGFKGCIQDSSYWCETLNPSHVTKPVFLELNTSYEQTKQQTPNLSFESWLETEEALNILESNEGSRDISQFQVAYLNSEQRTQHRVECRKDGNDTILYYQGAPLNTEHFQTEAGIGRAIFVIGPDHELYAGSHNNYQFHHTSFFKGRPVIGAGEIITDSSGKLMAITDKSGHYKPSKMHMADALKFLEKEKNVDLTNVTLILVPKKVMKQNGEFFSGRFNASEYCSTDGSIKPAPLADEDYR